MEFVNILAIAVALAMDAFAVAIATGVTLKKVHARQFFRLSWHFGLFQALMPIIGWSAGMTIYKFIIHVDHWIAFGLLAYVGFHMIREALAPDDEEESLEKKDPTKGKSMVMLSVATSIDALAIGFSMSMVGVTVFFPALIIGITALLFTIAGLYIGERVGRHSHLGQYAEILGGVVLFLIGFNILREHGVFDFLKAMA